MVPLRLEVDQAVVISRAFARAPAIALDELETTIGSLMQYLQRETQENTPTDLGQLRSAFVTDVQAFTQLDAVFGTLSNALPYAIPVELGTKPHFPPLAPLVSWVERKLELFGAEAEAAARGIQRKIGREGSPGYGMARFALLDGRDTIAAEFAECAARITARIEAEGGAA